MSSVSHKQNANGQKIPKRNNSERPVQFTSWLNCAAYETGSLERSVWFSSWLNCAAYERGSLERSVWERQLRTLSLVQFLVELHHLWESSTSEAWRTCRSAHTGWSAPLLCSVDSTRGRSACCGRAHTWCSYSSSDNLRLATWSHSTGTAHTWQHTTPAIISLQTCLHSNTEYTTKKFFNYSILLKSLSIFSF